VLELAYNTYPTKLQLVRDIAQCALHREYSKCSVSSQILGHQLTESIPCQPLLHQSYGLGMTGLKVYFRGKLTCLGNRVSGGISYSLDIHFSLHIFVDLLTNFRFQRAGD
jgi:hypothetical protein